MSAPDARDPARTADTVACFFCNSPVPEFPVPTCAHCGTDPRPPQFVVAGYRHPNVTHVLHSLDQCVRWGHDDKCVEVYERLLIDGSECGPVGRQSPADPHPTGST